MRIKFRIISFILLVGMLFNIFTIIATASSTETNKITLSVGKIDGTNKKGSTITVPIKIKGSTDLSSFSFKISYNNKYLTPKSVKNGKLWDSEIVSNLKYNQNTILITSACSENVKTEDGIICYVKFFVNKKIKNGKYTIKISVPNFKRIDSEYELVDIPYEVTNGYIRINKSNKTINPHDKI